MNETKERVERRTGPGKQRTQFFPMFAFIFSLAGFIGWLLPMDRSINESASPLLGFMFAVMTLITGLGVGLSFFRGKTFERRA